MIPTFPELLKTSGPKLLDPIGFSKYKGQRIYEIPEIYWQRYCTQSGIDHNVILKKISEAKEELRNLQNRQTRKKLDIDKIRNNFELNGETVILMNHQCGYVKFHGDSNYSLLAADIGTGKTFSILEYIRLRWMPYDKCIILAPPNVFSSWQKAIDDYFYCKATHIAVSGTSKQRLNLLNFKRNFYIINYESVSRIEKIREKLKDMCFTWIIADEADEYLCNPKTKNWKYVMELSANIEMRDILTGTPRRQKDESIYGLVTFLDRGERFGISFEKFKDKYLLKELPSKYLKERYALLQSKSRMNNDEKKEYMKLKGMMLTRLNPAYEKEFYEKLSSIMYRVNKRDVLDLPPLTHEVIQIELTGASRKNYIDMHKHSIIEIDNYCKLTGEKKKFSVEAGIVLARMMKLRQISCGYIHDTATKETVDLEKDKLNYLNGFLDRINEPVIITCVHTKEIRDIEDLLKQKGLKYGIIAGLRTTNKKNIEISRDLFSRGKLDALISQEQAGRAGIDGLQNNCSLMFEYSYGYSSTTWKQKIGRIERKGQKRPMTLITAESVIDRKELIDRAIINTIQMGNDGFEYLVENLRKINRNLIL